MADRSLAKQAMPTAEKFATKRTARLMPQKLTSVVPESGYPVTVEDTMLGHNTFDNPTHVAYQGKIDTPADVAARQAEHEMNYHLQLHNALNEMVKNNKKIIDKRLPIWMIAGGVGTEGIRHLIQNSQGEKK